MRKRQKNIRLATRRARWQQTLAGCALAGLIIGATLICHLLASQMEAIAHVSSASPSLSANSSYLYFVLKQTGGFVLARAHAGPDDEPVDEPQVVASFDGGFGQSIADTIISLQASPDRRYLAIDGTRSDGELLWIFDTANLTLHREPADVSGTFLRWLPGTDGLFLYRPMFPSGPDASPNPADWHPGLWLGNATTGTFLTIDIHMPSTFLIDAIASPDGSQILYSTSSGLGMGSDIWSIDVHGQQRTHILRLADSAQSIAGMFTWSPDGENIAYERLNDSPTPFLPAGLWIMTRQGGDQRLLAQADGGHGFTLRWSPDSSKIAFVARTNPMVSMADQSMQALQSAIDVVDISSGHVWAVASPMETNVQINANPVWSADSSHITFAAFNPLNPAIGGTVHYWTAQARHAGMRPNVAQISQPITHVIAPGS